MQRVAKPSKPSYSAETDENIIEFLKFQHKSVHQLINEYITSGKSDIHNQILNRVLCSPTGEEALKDWFSKQALPIDFETMSKETLVIFGDYYLFCVKNASADAYDCYTKANSGAEVNVDALYGLACLHLGSDKTSAKICLENIAQVNPSAAYELALLDSKNKKRHMQTALQGGDDYALTRSASFKHLFEFMYTDKESSVSLYQLSLAARLGNVVALGYLGRCYALGTWVDQDSARAALYYRLAVKYGARFLGDDLKEMLANSNNPTVIYHAAMANHTSKQAASKFKKLITAPDFLDALIKQDQALGEFDEASVKSLLDNNEQQNNKAVKTDSLAAKLFEKTIWKKKKASYLKVDKDGESVIYPNGVSPRRSLP